MFILRFKVHPRHLAEFSKECLDGVDLGPTLESGDFEYGGASYLRLQLL